MTLQEELIDREIPSPPDMTPYPFQVEGIKFARGKQYLLIADEMGLGKTPQAIGIINDNPDFKSILIICPATLKTNWERELGKWLYDQSLLISTTATKSLPDTDIVIVNYDRVHSIPLRDREWDMIILDEAHYIKNDQARRTREIVGFRDKPRLNAKKVVLLSGTPMANRPLDMYTICKYCDPETFSNKWAYLARYCDPKIRYGRRDFSGASNLEELSRKLKKFMIRRFKREVLPQLPPKQYQVIELNPMGLQLSLINKELSLTEFVDQSARVRVKLEDTSTIRKELGEAKVPIVINRLRDMLEDYEGKIVVFAHHRQVIARLKEAFDSTAVVVNGEMSTKAKQASIDAFKNDPGIRLFIGSLSSAGVGITLTNASLLVFAEMDYSPGIMDQAEDRIHRISQEADTVQIVYMVYKNSLDANIAYRLAEKGNVIQKAVGK